MTPDRETRKKQITAKRQEQILDASLELFASKGFSAATIPEIAKLAGVAAGTIYLYFPSKRDLFLEVIKKNILTGPLIQMVQKIPVADFGEVFREILRNRIELAEQKNISRIAFLMGEIQREPEIKEMFAKGVIQPFLANMEAFYRGRVESKEFKDVDPAIAVRLMSGMFIGFVFLSSIEDDASPLNKVPREKIAFNIMQFVFGGISNAPAANIAREEDTL
jgi:AcrR family transcriptional regulator